MTNQIYTAAGCVRCKITKQFMQENDIDYEEYDFKADGKEIFSQFYRANRKAIFRDKDGVEFPVFTDGKVIRQGLSVIVGYLVAGDNLKGFIGRSLLHGEWIDGFDLSGGNPQQAQGLIAVLRHLKKNGLKIQLTTSGKNASVLETVLEQKLGDRVIMDVKGPSALYGRLAGEAIDSEEITRSIALVARFPEFAFTTTVAPVVREDESVSYLTPEEIGETAKMIEAASGSKKNPYHLKRFDPDTIEDDAITSIEPLPDSAIFKYRTAARRYQVMTEIDKQRRK
jgi:pyruvate formate lyase activating enzyme